MRLDFNILWVEDQPKNVESQRKRIEMLMRKQGFKLQTKTATSIEEAKTSIGDDIFGDHIDLILMDFDFGGGPDGEYGLGMVRDSFPYKDIVFYSAQVPQQLEDIVARNKLPGVFCCHRDNLPDTVVGVFETLVKKVLDIDHCRGIAMGATSEIDGFVSKSLQDLLGRDGKIIVEEASKIVADQLKDIQDRFKKGCDRIAQAKAISEIFELHHIYTSAHRLRLFRKILEKLGLHEAERELMIKYEAETVPKRNDLAHVTVVRNGFARTIFDRNGKELTTDDMQALRVALLENHELFEGVLNSLSTSDAT